jgi:hypothetical protein
MVLDAFSDLSKPVVAQPPRNETALNRIRAKMAGENFLHFMVFSFGTCVNG